MIIIAASSRAEQRCQPKAADMKPRQPNATESNPKQHKAIQSNQTQPTAIQRNRKRPEATQRNQKQPKATHSTLRYTPNRLQCGPRGGPKMMPVFGATASAAALHRAVLRHHRVPTHRPAAHHTAVHCPHRAAPHRTANFFQVSSCVCLHTSACKVMCQPLFKTSRSDVSGWPAPRKTSASGE